MLIPQVWPGSSVLLFKGAVMWIASRAAGQIQKRGGIGFSSSHNGKLARGCSTLLKWKAQKTSLKISEKNQGSQDGRRQNPGEKGNARRRSCDSASFPPQGISQISSSSRETKSWAQLLAVLFYYYYFFVGKRRTRSRAVQVNNPGFQLKCKKEAHPGSRGAE